MSNRILLVDGNDGVCDCLSEGLMRHGYEVETVRLGWAAEMLMEQTNFDLLIVDVMLEGSVSGLDLAKRFIELYPRRRVIAVASYPAPALKEAAERIGVDGYLMKPADVSPDNLVAHVRRVLGE